MWTKIKDFFSYGEQIYKQKNHKSTNQNSLFGAKTKKDSVSSKGRTNNLAIHTAVQKKKLAIKHGYKGPTCQYCGSQSEIKTAKEHRGRDNDYCYWVCPTCPNTSVTTRKGSYEPSGDLADAETRLFRMEVQKLLQNKRASSTRDELRRWIHETTHAPLERSYVGRLSKDDLVKLAVRTQKEEFEKKYGYIFNKVED